ncbi:glycine betaine ABC transporter substrate-binding protein [Methanogenium organophilum]|uniref:Glycine betaine ABC transporter substrate-binding protein n=1 Tax=Methanogenium organophilum TaxID=2199 RepID=A0A9X9S6B0_METOG|nr:glycine betaine ABC transporter substrate-binding protein [Methanogenium organophilum]WAI02476.1 glycine betaine ABC transporter substrate-binding protein [Methanogenium organophilum]
MLFGIIFVAGCTDSAGTAAAPETGTDAAKEVSIGYVLWDSEIASTNVLKTVYEQAGYDVELKAVDAGPLYQALADGQVDMSVSAWLPATHAAYMDTYGDDIMLVGKNLEGAKVGLVVPQYVTIDSIDEMNDVADQFDGKIIGIEPGAGIMAMTETAIENYSLDYTLVPSSSAAMAAQLSDAYENEEWVVVTGWTPHWKFVRFDLKYLDDPEGVYGGEEYIASLARTGFVDENPEAFAILERFSWEPSDMESVMLAVEEGATPEDAAQAWVDEHLDQVQSWING